MISLTSTVLTAGVSVLALVQLLGDADAIVAWSPTAEPGAVVFRLVSDGLAMPFVLLTAVLGHCRRARVLEDRGRARWASSRCS